MAKIALFCYVLALGVALSVGCQFSIVMSGNYSIGSDSKKTWLSGGPFSFRLDGKWRSTDDGTLRMDMPVVSTSGTDEIGYYTDMQWNLTADDVNMEAVIRTYITPVVPITIFIQRFPQGLRGARFDVNKTITGFPSFRMQEPNETVGYLSFGSFMFGDRTKKAGKFGPNAAINDGLDGTGPLVLFNKQGQAVIISPYTQVMAASMWLDQGAGVLNWGIMGGVEDLPAGFEYKTMVYCSETGIGDAFAGWGDVMKQVHNKTEDVTHYHQSQDLSLTHLGYWTDNGAYYYYKTLEGKSYEETLLAVQKYSNDQHIPYSYLQLDSWFYFKDNLKAVTTWDAMESIFPKGIKSFQEKLQLPLVAHNRYWSVNTTYAKENGGHFDFIIGKQLSVPSEQIFWEYLFGHGREEWGLIVYEQDWLNVQLLFSEVLNSNLTMGRTWLMQMGQAAAKHELKIQYCMALSRHALQSLEIPTVTQARVSNDYHLDPTQWKIGVTSHFADAMGVAPSKDTFWTTSIQPGNSYNKQEPFPTLQGVVSVLSRGPVGPGDMIGGTNVSTLMRCCNEDGVILKPSKPARAVDDQLKEMAFNDGEGAVGEVWTTYSNNQNQLYGVILAANLSADYVITAERAGFLSKYVPKFTESVLFRYNGTSVNTQPFNSSSNFTINADECNTNGEPFCLFYTSPVLSIGSHKIAILGDLSKWVPMSNQRVFHIRQDSQHLGVTLSGKPGETIVLDYLLDGTVKSAKQVADSLGCADITILNEMKESSDEGTTVETTSTPATSTTQTTWIPSTTVGAECRFKPHSITTPAPKTSTQSPPPSTTDGATPSRKKIFLEAVLICIVGFLLSTF